MPTLVDTSAFYALIDADDAAHQAVRRFVVANADPLILPVTVLPEADHLLGTRLSVREELIAIRAILRGAFVLEQLGLDDLARAAELVEQYADSPLGLVDASIVAIAERLRITRILTLDRRHFGFVRPRHCSALDLVP